MEVGRFPSSSPQMLACRSLFLSWSITAFLQCISFPAPIVSLDSLSCPIRVRLQRISFPASVLSSDSLSCCILVCLHHISFPASDVSFHSLSCPINLCLQRISISASIFVSLSFLLYHCLLAANPNRLHGHAQVHVKNNLISWCSCLNLLEQCGFLPFIS